MWGCVWGRANIRAFSLCRRHRVAVRFGLSNAPTRAMRTERILAILVESGFLYCLSGVRHTVVLTFVVPSICQVALLVTCLIRLSAYGTLGDIYSPVGVQVAVRTIRFIFRDNETLTSTCVGHISNSCHRPRWDAMYTQRHHILARGHRRVAWTGAERQDSRNRSYSGQRDTEPCQLHPLCS